MNSSVIYQEHYDYQTSQGAGMAFWVLIAVWTLTCIAGIIGNSLVIYFASRKPKEDTFRHLNTVVRNLAITDFLYSVFGSPLTMVYWTWSKFWFSLAQEYLHN